MEVIPLSYRPAFELQSLINPLLEDSERIIANGSTLIIKATPSRLDELKRLIKKLDTRLTNLSITVLQSRTKTAEELNASANISSNHPVYQQLDRSGKLRGRFAQTEGLINTDSIQVVTTIEGKSAVIKAGNIHPVQNAFIYHSGYDYSVITSNTQFIEATTCFLVTPRLTGNLVILEISPWSDKKNINGFFETQAASTTIQVDLGVWVEIGGISEHRLNTRNRILSHSYSTKNNNLRILIKVEKSN